MRPLAVLILTFSSAHALAQQPGPQACGQEAETADYGSLDEGTLVVLQRHRFVGGDPNWDGRQGRFLGRAARVTRLSGVDERGCPGVRVDSDAGRWFWRVRDLNLGARRPTRVPPPSRSLSAPQQCGLTDATVTYGRLRVGTHVVLGRHRPVEGEPNWSDEMSPFIGRSARIVELAGVDEQGCPGVNVDADGRQWFWRVRALRLSDGETPIVFRPGLASDHGRPAAPERGAVPADPRVNQACGATDETFVWGEVAVGTEVVVGRHRPVDGEDNWVVEMEPFVGRRAQVTALVGVDEQGCGLVSIDLDEGDFFWRLRDLHLHTPPAAAAPVPQ